ncbi:hypothetical protein ANCCAN_30369 [Ancylostoma caninum]|uniref:SCP domain-containing protein n=1 Tax=Ancylostoma caninum TaxID=29170 RepID=A0A368EW71_ANCCA|nr:hypothetical protein ANCCAN_30369 [Ancylostoma caninum]
MTSLTGLLACAFCFLSLTYSAEASSQEVPECKHLGTKAIPAHHIRQKLAVEVMTYTCELEERAHSYVLTTGPVPQFGNDVVYLSGENLNLKKVVSEWRDKLRNVRAYPLLTQHH